jgi:hypothetical protein
MLWFIKRYVKSHKDIMGMFPGLTFEREHGTDRL